MRFQRLVVVVLIVSVITAGGGFLAPGTAEAGPPRLATVVLTDDKDRKVEKTIFTPTTAKIYAVFTLADVPARTPLKCVWIAEKTQVAPPNYKVDEVTLNVGGLITGGNCALSKPTNGWPVGDYRVDMYLGDQLAHTARFIVKV